MESGPSFPDDLFDPEFVKTEAKWARLAKRYDNLSNLPPNQQSAIDSYYLKTTSKGLECPRSANDYSDPWPVTKSKKLPPPPVMEDEFLTAGVSAKRREALNQELRDFQQAHDPDNMSDLSKAIAAKDRRFSQAQKGMANGQDQAAIKSQKIAMPALVNTHNTRSRAKTVTVGNNEPPASNMETTHNAIEVEADTALETTNHPENSAHGVAATNEQSLRTMPPFMPPLLMRNTRALSADHSRLNRPVRGVIPSSYYAANPQSNSEPAPAEDEPQEDMHMEAKPAGGQPTDGQLICDQLINKLPKEAERKQPAPTTKSSKKAGEPKQRRAVKACERCRMHKTRCIGGQPCDACVRRKFECDFASDEKKAPGKRPREEDHQPGEDEEHKAPIAKRARQEKVPAAKKKQPSEIHQPVEVKVPAARKKQPTKTTQLVKSKVPTAQKQQPSEIGQPVEMEQATKSAKGKAPAVKRAREETEPFETQPMKRRRSDGDEDNEAPEKVEEIQIAQPTKPAKPQCSKPRRGKRARDDSQDVEAPPAKQQRKDLDNPWRVLHHRIQKKNVQDAFLVEKMRFNSKEEVSNWVDTQEDAFHNRPSIKLVMPDLLKAILVDDWEHVTKDQQLVPLPHEHSVDQVLKDYLEDERSKREEGSTQMDILDETIAGLREYFERALGRILLYRFERLQYSEKRAEWEANANSEKPDGPSTTYGPEHLCRLLVSLPELIGQTNMDQQSVSRLREEITKFSNWLSKNSDKYFARQYEDPGAEYIEKARNA